ncbi:MAG: peroxiredoxin family protein [Acidobacteriota bacterium]|nr:peroxiredoxin family protein [Acidobacteriota bacterium]
MTILLAGLLALATAGVGAPQVERLGPLVGAAAPAFSLADQQGRTQTLSSVAGPKGTMLVFFRSADW